MFKKDDTIIIVGKSPFIDKEGVSDAVHVLKYRYHTIGINHACYLFNTEYFAFVDYGLKPYYALINPKTKLLTVEENATEMFEGEFLKLYIPKDNEPPVKDNYIAYCGFTHDMCLSWACSKGFKSAILIGVADFTQDYKYTSKCDNLPDKPTYFKASNKFRDMSVNYINNVLKKYINIYTANPESILDVERIDLKDLTK